MNRVETATDHRIFALERRIRELAEFSDSQTRRIRQLESDLAEAQAQPTPEESPFSGRRSVKEIISDVLRGYPGITWDDVVGARRSRRIIRPRHACMKAVYEERKDLSLPAMGRIFRRDHTAVLHAVRKETA
ncbi:chromosomal replication initiator DnaA [Sinorhizobium fredii]|uniref:Chromosomal replication initiator DnaA n=1 Tax=Rhizobium fredii TaxID=380 RepID=A0A2A6LY48_RHIFR|nr:chromosomal replication initiator DnaA [Sinorhizobium fredii]